MKQAKIYIISIIFVSLWWTLAFQTDDKIPFTPNYSTKKESGFSQINREDLKKALNGDTHLIIDFITKWDLEALEMKGLRLTAEEYRRAHQLSQKTLVENKKRFLPQTYAAASFMLALGGPEQITALPTGLRDQVNIFEKSVLDQVQHDSNRYNTELLSLDKPVAAFITTYSDPTTLQALKSQNIPTIALNDANTIPGIIEALNLVGNLTGNQEKAELITLFIKSALNALDNRKNALSIPKVLLAYQLGGLCLPTKKTLTGQILERIGIDTIDKNCWSIPLTHEYIEKIKPDLIIVATDSKQDGPYRYIPQNVQMFASQHFILAYFDILEAITL